MKPREPARDKGEEAEKAKRRDEAGCHQMGVMLAPLYYGLRKEEIFPINLCRLRVRPMVTAGSGRHRCMLETRHPWLVPTCRVHAELLARGAARTKRG